MAKKKRTRHLDVGDEKAKSGSKYPRDGYGRGRRISWEGAVGSQVGSGPVQIFLGGFQEVGLESMPVVVRVPGMAGLTLQEGQKEGKGSDLSPEGDQ